MVYQSFLINFYEIGTKGKNRYLFEDALIKQIKNAEKKGGGFLYSTQRSPAMLRAGSQRNMITMR